MSDFLIDRRVLIWPANNSPLGNIPMACVHTLIRKVKTLLSPPEIGIKVSSMLKQPDVSLRDVAALVEKDPAISAALLRIANSSLLGASKEIVSVNRAMLRLGTDQTAELAIGISVANAFKGIDANVVTVDEIWRHSMLCAAGCRLIADKLRLPDRDAAFTSGLLHDIGRLVLLSHMPDEMSRVFQLTNPADGEGIDEVEAELQVLQFDHGECGELLAWQWKLPVEVSRCMRYHHDPAAAPADSLLPSVVHLANAIAHGVDAGVYDLAYDELQEGCLARLGVSPAEIPDLMETVRAAFEEIRDITPAAA